MSLDTKTVATVIEIYKEKLTSLQAVREKIKTLEPLTYDDYIPLADAVLGHLDWVKKEIHNWEDVKERLELAEQEENGRKATAHQ